MDLRDAGEAMDALDMAATKRVSETVLCIAAPSRKRRPSVALNPEIAR